MRALLVATALALSPLALAACGGGSSPSPGPTCRTGCPCGRSCISCRDTCRMAASPLEIEDGGTDQE